MHSHCAEGLPGAADGSRTRSSPSSEGRPWDTATHPQSKATDPFHGRKTLQEASGLVPPRTRCRLEKRFHHIQQRKTGTRGHQALTVTAARLLGPQSCFPESVGTGSWGPWLLPHREIGHRGSGRRPSCAPGHEAGQQLPEPPGSGGQALRGPQVRLNFRRPQLPHVGSGNAAPSPRTEMSYCLGRAPSNNPGRPSLQAPSALPQNSTHSSSILICRPFCAPATALETS